MTRDKPDHITGGLHINTRPDFITSERLVPPSVTSTNQSGPVLVPQFLAQPIRCLHRHGEWARVEKPQLVSCWPLNAAWWPFLWAQQNYTMAGFQNDVISSITGQFNFLYGLPRQMRTCGNSLTCVVDESHDQYTERKSSLTVLEGRQALDVWLWLCVCGIWGKMIKCC